MKGTAGQGSAERQGYQWPRKKPIFQNTTTGFPENDVRGTRGEFNTDDVSVPRSG